MFPALIGLLCALLLPVGPSVAQPLAVHPFVASTGLAGPVVARGAVVWLPGSYNPQTEPAPPVPEWLRHVTSRGYDLWLFDRGDWRRDPLPEGRERLLQGLAALRTAGYRRVVVAGFSRGAFIGLAALARPDLADAVAAISPAAHGRDPARRPQALAEFAAQLQAASASRFALALLHDDPWDPGPEQRAALARDSAPGVAGALLLIDRPDAPRDHMGSFEPEFEARFGSCLAAFLDGGAAACPGG